MAVSLSAGPARPRWTTGRCSAGPSSPRSRPGVAYGPPSGPSAFHGTAALDISAGRSHGGSQPAERQDLLVAPTNRQPLLNRPAPPS